MLKLSIFSALMLFTIFARAECPVADQLISKYGISFSGFKTYPPKSNPPHLRSGDNAVLIMLPNKKGYVPDGFFHSAVISTVGNRVWLHRIGGFPSVNEWYGPIEVGKLNLTGCRFEKYAETGQ